MEISFARPRYRLHASSIVVLLLTLFGLAVWNASAFYSVRFLPFNESWRHGWPATFLTREVQGFTAADLWGMGKGVRTFEPSMLILDACVVVALAVTVALAFEWRRRRRPGVMSVNLKEFFLIAAIAAAMLGVWFQARAHHHDLRRIVESLGGPEVINYADQSLPRWLWAWLPGDAFKIGDNPVSINFRKLDNPAVSLAELPKLTDVRSLSFYGSGGIAIDAHADFLRKMGQLEVLFLTGTDFSNAGMPHLAGLTGLRRLHLTNSITGEGLVHLKDLTQLEELSFDFSPQIVWDKPQITDAGFAHLAGLKRLKTLRIYTGRLTSAGTKHLVNLNQLTVLDLSADMSDEALEPISKLESLEQLNLMGHKLTEAGVVHLQGLKNLKQLLLQNTLVGDRGLEKLATMTALQRLYLNGSFGILITDAGVEHLRKLHDLEVLNLNQAGITDRCLETLGDMPSLHEVWLQSTAVTDVGVAKLQLRRPDLKINK